MNKIRNSVLIVLCVLLCSLSANAATGIDCKITVAGSGFVVGDTADMAIAINNSTGQDIPVDAYILRASPDGKLAFYSPFGSFIDADLLDLTTWTPFVSNFAVPAGFNLSDTALLNETFSDSSPLGTYTYYFLLSPGNSIDPLSNIIGLDYFNFVLFASNGQGTQHTGIIDADETWYPSGNPHIVTGNVTVAGPAPQGVTLTILPGVIVRMEEDTSIEIGNSNEPGTLIAQGNKGAGIIFTSNQTTNTKGWWKHIKFYGQAVDSKMSHCVVEYGGGYDSWSSRGNIVIYESSNVDIDNCTIINSKSSGVAFPNDDGLGTFTANTITGNTTYGIRLSADQVRGINADNSVAGNALGGIYVEADTVENDAAWHILDAAYILETFKIASPNGTTLTIEPGTVLKFIEDASIEVGNTNEPGKLVAEGSKELPILFTSNQTSKTKGWWNHIRFTENDNASSLSYCQIEYGGGNNSWSSSANLVIDGAGNVKIDQCTISNSLTAGIAYPVSDEGLATITNSVLNNNDTYGINIFANHVRGIDGSNSVKDNTLGGLYVRKDTVDKDATWPKLDAPYILEGLKLANSNGVTLTIEAGVKLTFITDKLFEVGDNNGAMGTLIAKGTLAEPIIFTRKLPVGNWYGIKFNMFAYNCILDYCTVEYGGGFDSWSGKANVATSSETTKLTNCTLSNSKGYGIKLMDSASADLTGTSFNNNSGEDIYYYSKTSGYTGQPVQPFTIGQDF
jgi:parallel beta-helix repeat protein